MASEEMSFENVEDGRRVPAYTICSPMIRLRWTKNQAPVTIVEKATSLRRPILPET